MKNNLKLVIFIVGILLMSSVSINVVGTPSSSSKEIIGVEQYFRVLIEKTNANLHASLLLSEGYDVLDITQTSIELIVSESRLQSLKQRNYKPMILEESRPLYDIIQEQEATGKSSIPPGYQDHSDILDEMDTIESTYLSH